MTLTTILPTLRRSIPDPLDSNRWPERTRATTTDVVVCGVSLLGLVELCGTPCVHSAAGAAPGTGGRPSPLFDASAVVLRITEVLHSAEGATLVLLDGRLDHPGTAWGELRLIGRASTAHDAPATVLGGAERSASVELPADVRPGDLLAVPVRGVPCLRELRG
ncbi:hypothetical protein [Arenivirga flava]|uniref:Uncharacterized protein n=1 Tax=Arenivirga flava TaxID=1930060 RepID=A0AA37UGV8_9MICO|nr:hypothetical protein [Arenivirga flava]GMA28508.1 hypothetical protein GCM10025874_17610 [Arenivirga flava]